MTYPIHTPASIAVFENWKFNYEQFFNDPVAELRKIPIHFLAEGLCRFPRYGGMSPKPWTLGQHSLLVHICIETRLEYASGISADEEWARIAALHDLSELFFGDILAPLKSLARAQGKDFGLISEGHAKFEEALHKRFNFPLYGSARADVLHEADRLALQIEAGLLWGPYTSRGWTGVFPQNEKLPTYAFHTALAAGRALPKLNDPDYVLRWCKDALPPLA